MVLVILKNKICWELRALLRNCAVKFLSLRNFRTIKTLLLLEVETVMQERKLDGRYDAMRRPMLPAAASTIEARLQAESSLGGPNWTKLNLVELIDYDDKRRIILGRGGNENLVAMKLLEISSHIEKRHLQPDRIRTQYDKIRWVNLTTRPREGKFVEILWDP